MSSLGGPTLKKNNSSVQKVVNTFWFCASISSKKWILSCSNFKPSDSNSFLSWQIWINNLKCISLSFGIWVLIKNLKFLSLSFDIWVLITQWWISPKISDSNASTLEIVSLSLLIVFWIRFLIWKHIFDLIRINVMAWCSGEKNLFNTSLICTAWENQHLQLKFLVNRFFWNNTIFKNFH